MREFSNDLMPELFKHHGVISRLQPQSQCQSLQQNQYELCCMFSSLLIEGVAGEMQSRGAVMHKR